MKILQNGHFKRALDAELTWLNFRDNLADQPHSDRDRVSGRYIRLSPHLRRVPKLDAKDELDGLQVDAVQILKSGRYKNKIAKIALQLVASSFYYEKTSAPRPAEFNMFVCSGMLTQVEVRSVG